VSRSRCGASSCVVDLQKETMLRAAGGRPEAGKLSCGLWFACSALERKKVGEVLLQMKWTATGGA